LSLRGLFVCFLRLSLCFLFSTFRFLRCDFLLLFLWSDFFLLLAFFRFFFLFFFSLLLECSASVDESSLSSELELGAARP